VLSATELGVAILFVLALLVLSIVDIAFINTSRLSFRRILDNPSIKVPPSLPPLLESRTEVLMSIHLLIQVLLVSGAVFLFTVFNRYDLPYVASLPGTIGVMFVIIMLFRQLIPRLIVARNAEMTLIYLSPALRLSWLLMRPFARLMTVVLNYFHSWEEEHGPDKEEETKTTDEEIQAFIDAGQEEGILEHDEGEMIQSIVHFGEKVVREVMTPRTQIVAIDIGSSVEKLLNLITTRSHTRIPVYRDDLDNIEGFIHERDLLRLWQRPDTTGSQRPLARLVRPVHFVPETKPVDDLLNEMKQRGDQIVLVVDEYGGTSGLVTLEDLVEEIVGEIHDKESGDERIIEESPGTYIVPGSLELGGLEEMLGMPFVEETKCTTVAGAVVELFGKLPVTGEKIEHQNISVEVLDADRRKVHRLRMKVLAAPRT
jgi:putative hemolysin